MAHVLVIDDDAEIREVLTLALEGEGHRVSQAEDGVLGLQASGSAEVIISDVNMPGLDGFSLCRKLRAAGNTVPVLLLTSRDSDIDEALGLELGADDYVAKPFSTRVLLARVAALVRREAARKTPAQAAPAGDLQLDDERLSVAWKGTPFSVTVTEFRLLQALSERPGIVFSRSRLLELLRGDDVIVTERVIDTYVRRLRRKMEEIDPKFAGIETVVGAGYKWQA